MTTTGWDGAAKQRLAARLQGLAARHAPANPIAAEEARRMGERPDEPIPPDPSVTFVQAEATMSAALGATVKGRYHRTADDQWLDTATGEVTTHMPN